MSLSIDPTNHWPLSGDWNDRNGGITLSPNGSVFDSVNKKLGSSSAYSDGIDDFIIDGDTSTFKRLHGALDTSSFKWTICFWIRMPVPEPDAFLGLLSTTSTSSTNVGFDIYYDDTSGSGRSRNFGVFIARGVGGTSVINFVSPNDIYPNDTDFHWVCVTYDQSLGSSNCNIYVDNVLKATGNKSGSTPSTANSTYSLHINSLGSGTNFMESNLNQLIFFDDVITSGDRGFLYNSGNGVDLGGFGAGLNMMRVG